MEQEIRLKRMPPEKYHEYFKEYQNDPDLYIDPAKCASKISPVIRAPQWASL